jgi:EGF domain-specific O-GlcNAc transferase
MLSASFPPWHRILLVSGILICLVFTVLSLQPIQSRTTEYSESEQLLPHHDDGPSRESPPAHPDTVLSLPPEYQQAPKEQPFCAERFGLPYLQNLASSAVSYCDPNSASSLTCFRTQIDPKHRIDSFCIGGPATYDSKKFVLDCSLRQWSLEEASQGIPRLEQFPTYWYATGPSFLFNDYIRMNAGKEIPTKAPAEPRNFSILIKREESNYNVWHSLMEILALYMTLDVLRMTPDPATKRPFFSTEDFDNSQVVILDDLLDGPFFDLWTLFAKQPPIRLQDVSDASQINLENIIVPLPGGANPFWQGDWEPLACDRSELLQTFARRVLDFYKVGDHDLGPEDRPLVLTFIDRTTKRRLIDQGPYLERLRVRFPAVDIKVVDFAVMTFSEQLKIIRHTDILAGVRTPRSPKSSHWASTTKASETSRRNWIINTSAATRSNTAPTTRRGTGNRMIFSSRRTALWSCWMSR